MKQVGSHDVRSTYGLAPQNPARRRPRRGSWAQQRLSPATPGYKTLFPNLAIGRGAAVATHTAVIVIGCCRLFLPVLTTQTDEGGGHEPPDTGVGPSPPPPPRQPRRAGHRRPDDPAAISSTACWWPRSPRSPYRGCRSSPDPRRAVVLRRTRAGPYLPLRNHLIFAFTATWPEFLPALRFHSGDGHRTVPVGIAPSPTGTPSPTGRCSRGRGGRPAPRRPGHDLPPPDRLGPVLRGGQGMTSPPGAPPLPARRPLR